jgi:hypothetical protein
MPNLGVYGNINDCRIESLKVRPALHWLAKQGPVTECVSGGRRYYPLSEAYLSISMRLIFQRYVPGSAMARSEKTAYPTVKSSGLVSSNTGRMQRATEPIKRSFLGGARLRLWSSETRDTKAQMPLTSPMSRRAEFLPLREAGAFNASTIGGCITTPGLMACTGCITKSMLYGFIDKPPLMRFAVTGDGLGGAARPHLSAGSG